MKKFAIIRSVDAPNHVSAKELCAYTEGVITKMSRAGTVLPPILVMHVSESVAAVVGVGRSGVIRHNRSKVTGFSSYYEIWLVGEAGLADYILALEGIVSDVHAGSDPSGLEMFA